MACVPEQEEDRVMGADDSRAESRVPDGQGAARD